MKLDYKIYTGKDLIAATSGAFHAAHVASITINGVVKYAGRVVWKEEKDRGALNNHSAVTVMGNRIRHHREQAAAKYEALKMARNTAYGEQTNEKN